MFLNAVELLCLKTAQILIKNILIFEKLIFIRNKNQKNVIKA